MDEIWARNLRTIRKARKMTQIQLAEKADVSRATITALENGNAEPSLRILQKIAAALDVPYELVFADPVITAQYAEHTADELKTRFVDFLRFDSEGSRKTDLLEAFAQLNEIGQIEAIKRIVEMGAIEEYRKQV